MRGFKSLFKWIAYSVLALVLLVLLFWLGLRMCATFEPEHEPARLDAQLLDMIEDGDFVLRMGRGFFSPSFASTSPTYRDYSHIGILHHTPQGIQVMHAVADDYGVTGEVKSEPLESFLSPQDATQWAVFRPFFTREQKQALVGAAKTFLGMPFDYCFDHSDKSALYCTEFVEEALLKSGCPTPFTYTSNGHLSVGEFQKPSFAQPLWRSTEGRVKPALLNEAD